MIKAFRVAMATAITAASVVGVGTASAQDGEDTFATGFNLVNLSDTEANVTISFYAEGQGTAQTTFNTAVPAGEPVTFAELSVIEGLNEGFSGSAVVSSDQEVAAVVNVVRNGDLAVGAGYSAVSEGAQEVIIPLLFKNFTSLDFDSYFNVQNVGTEVANVTVTYEGGATETATVQPGSSARFDQGTNPDLPDGFNSSAAVTSDQPIAVAVVQNGNTVLGYNAIASPSTTPLFPLVAGNNSNFFSGVSIRNVGDQSTDVTVSYAPSQAGTACTETQTIPSGEARNFALYTLDATTGDSDTPITTDCDRSVFFVGSGQVTTNSANQPLAATVNQQNNVNVSGGSYTAVDPSEASGTLVMPIIQDTFFGFFTGFSIVNVGDAPTSIECTYAQSDVTQSVENLAPGATWTAQQSGVIPANTDNGYNGSGVCTASASGAQIIGVLNQLGSGEDDSFFVTNAINN
ncbi:MAG: hypothetical protein GFH27_549293n167 [Chloroflexi bacterium AL-W]|nr:hypothetical protein [Chloroflexi bacterium AL-N1]NOK67718.1 hypothetical protein [Chloroflexi bacterium AL-N10]NOK75512.1 hypothetical protein [Chloroflexi bacterium AL-N5]NOK82300.1 hypothetical protein [Chloroflexi bacterium AL-W]NOK90145.1 hypothetical protein [Chloroflexi bacterium AL-N15]